MSDSTNPPNPTDEPRAEALAWLAGQFRWESLLADLHELAEREAAPRSLHSRGPEKLRVGSAVARAGNRPDELAIAA